MSTATAEALLEGFSQDERKELLRLIVAGGSEPEDTPEKAPKPKKRAKATRKPTVEGPTGGKRERVKVSAKILEKRDRNSDAVYTALAASKIGRKCIETATEFVLRGDWTWIAWDKKPAAGLTKYLYTEGWQFSGRRKAWFHTGGVNTRGRYRGNLDDRYEPQELS